MEIIFDSEGAINWIGGRLKTESSVLKAVLEGPAQAKGELDKDWQCD